MPSLTNPNQQESMGHYDDLTHVRSLANNANNAAQFVKQQLTNLDASLSNVVQMVASLDGRLAQLEQQVQALEDRLNVGA